MRPFANKEFQPEELELFEKIRRCVEGLPDYEEVTCHELARGVSLAFNIPVADGHWLIGFEHSWVYIPGSGHVIDVYPIGHAGNAIRPIFVDSFVAYHWLRDGRRLYDTARTPGGITKVRADVVDSIHRQLESYPRHGTPEDLEAKEEQIRREL